MWKIKKGYNSINKTLRLPEEMVESMEKLAFQNNISLNQLVIQCLDFALENLETEEALPEANQLGRRKY